jgi:hypothetical protein
VLGDDHPNTISALRLVAASLIRTGRYQEAETHVVAFYEPDETPDPRWEAPSPEACRLLADVYMECGESGRSVAWRSRLPYEPPQPGDPGDMVEERE